MIATTLISNEIVLPHFVYLSTASHSFLSLSFTFSTLTCRNLEPNYVVAVCVCVYMLPLRFVLHGYFTTGFTFICKYTYTLTHMHPHKQMLKRPESVQKKKKKKVADVLVYK